MIAPEPSDNAATTGAMIEISGIGRYCIRVSGGFREDGDTRLREYDILTSSVHL